MNRHWTVRVGDVAEINPSAPKGVRDDEPVAFVPMAAVSEEGKLEAQSRRSYREVKKGYSYFERGDVLVAKITPCFENGKATLTDNLVEKIGFGSTEFHVLRPGPDLDARYLFYAIWNKRFRAAAAKGMTGSAGQKRVPTDLLRRTEIRLPPLGEQRRIAAILDKADALRQKRKRAIALLDSLTQSIFLEMFGDLLANSGQTDRLTLAEMIAEGDRLNYGVVQPGDQVDGGVPIVRVSDLIDGRVAHSDLKSISPAISAGYQRSVLNGSEILVSCVGSIGEIALTTENEVGFNIARAVARIPLDQRYSRLYVAEFLRTDHVRRYFTRELRTVSQPTLNIKQISETLVPIPPSEQARAFESRVAAVEAMHQHEQTAITAQESLFASLQHRAFSGQL